MASESPATNRESGSTATIRFEEVPVGSAFQFRGKRFVKVALNLAEDENRKGNLFLAETQVERETDSLGSR